MKKLLTFIGLSSCLIMLSCGLPPREKALSILESGLGNESVIIRVNAARGLAETGDNRGTVLLYETLRGDNKDAIVAALNALIDLKEKKLSPIVAELTNNESPLIRAEAFHLVAGMPDPECTGILVRGTGDKIARIRRHCYEGLAKFNQADLIRPGLRDKDVYVRIAAARSLGALREKGLENMIRKELDPKKPNAEVWSEGILALAAVNDTGAVNFIKDLLVDTPWDLRLAAAQALLMLKNYDGLDVLKTALASPDPFIRVKAVEIARNFPLAEIYDLVKGLTGDPYINVSIGAVEALKVYRKKESRAVYENLLSAPNPLLRIAAATAYLKQ